MKLKDIAKDCGVHYQMAARFARKLLAERAQAMTWGHDFDEADAAVLKDRLKGNVSPMRTTAPQRLAWSETWRKALAKAEGTAWVSMMVVLASIDQTKNSGWLTGNLDSRTIGDWVLFFAGSTSVDRTEDGYTGFTAWLQEAGFKA